MCSLGKTLLAFALLHFVLQDQTCLLLQVSLTSYFCIPEPYDGKGIFFGISSRRSCGEGNGIRLKYSCLETPMDGGAWSAVVHGVTKRWTGLSDFTFTFHCPALEKDMATQSSFLSWRIPGTGSLVGCHPWSHTELAMTEAT